MIFCEGTIKVAMKFGISLIIAMFAITSKFVASRNYLTNSLQLHKIVHIKGGAGQVILNKKAAKQKLTAIYMFKMFWKTLIDPSASTQSEDKGSTKKGNGKKQTVGGGPHGGFVGGGASFGPVCGPNGCR